MGNTYVFKEDVFISNFHFVKAGAEVKILCSSREEYEIVLTNDPFNEIHRVDKGLLITV